MELKIIENKMDRNWYGLEFCWPTDEPLDPNVNKITYYTGMNVSRQLRFEAIKHPVSGYSHRYYSDRKFELLGVESAKISGHWSVPVQDFPIINPLAIVKVPAEDDPNYGPFCNLALRGDLDVPKHILSREIFAGVETHVTKEIRDGVCERTYIHIKAQEVKWFGMTSEQVLTTLTPVVNWLE